MQDENRGSPWLITFAISGMLSFALLIAAVILSVLISNTLRRLCRKHKYSFRQFLDKLGHALNWPTQLFIVGCTAMLVELEVYLTMNYGRLIAVAMSVVWLVLAAVVFWFYRVSGSLTDDLVEKAELHHGTSLRKINR